MVTHDYQEIGSARAESRAAQEKPRKKRHPLGNRGVFDAIADPTRRAILDGLSDGPRAAGVIAGDFGVSRPAISKHLRVLESAGLIRVTKEGRFRMYELDPGPLLEVDAWVGRYRTLWAARLVAIKRELERVGAVEREAGSIRGEGQIGSEPTAADSMGKGKNERGGGP